MASQIIDQRRIIKNFIKNNYMRKQFVNTVKEIIKKNKNLFIILCDIGVFGFREIFQKWRRIR